MIRATGTSTWEGLRRALLGLGPVLVLALFALTLGAVLSSAGTTLGYDFEAYRRAAVRILDGQPLYDPGASVAGPFAVYLYPPPFALAITPLALLPAEVSRLTWIGGMAAAFLAGTACLPVRAGVRWAIIGLAAICWPFLYAVKLGQVGPLLYLAFAIAWRAAEAPIPRGLAIAAGTLTKLQPGLLFAWLAVRRQGRALVVGLAACAVAVLAATLVVGIGAWHDYVDLLGRVSDPLTTPKNMTPGAIAYRAGLGLAAAGAIQWASVAIVCLVTVVTWLRRSAAIGLLVGVVASQLVSPVLWDHYTMLVLLPVALLLQRRQWWAAALPVLPWLGAEVLYPGVLAAAALALALGPRQEDDIPLIRAWPGTAGW